MSEIRERAQWLVDMLREKDDQTCGESLAIKITTDLLDELKRVEKERDRLADDALTALSGVVCTPIEGFVKVPYELKTGIIELRKLKEAAEQRIAELEAENVALKAAIQSDSPLRLVCSSDKNGALIYEKKLYNAAKFLVLNQFEEPT